MSEDRPALKAGVVRTFLIADIRGYTRFTQEQGDDRASELAARFAVVVRAAMPHWGGELLELRGDEALCVFASARQALGAAVDLQGRFRRPGEDGAAFPLGVGIGLDAGEAVPVDGGYRGGALNLAARLCARAAAGEILASEQVVHLARRIEGMRFESPRLVRFKGIDGQVRVVRIIPSEQLPPAPRPAPKRRRPLPALLAAAAAVAIVAALVAARERGSSPATPTAPFRATIVSKVEIGDKRTVLSSGSAGIILAQQSGTNQGVVDRIAQGDGSRVLLAKIASAPLGIGIGNRDVWVLTVPTYRAQTARLIRIEPDHRLTELALPGRPGCADFGVVTCNPVIGAGSVWVPVGTSVYRVRVDDHSIQARIDVGARIFDIAYGAASTWVLSGTDLVQIDTHGNTQHRLHLAPRLGASLQPTHLTISPGGDLWISCFSTDSHREALIHVQPWRPTLGITTLVAYPGAGPLRASGTSLWVSSLNSLQRLDAHNGQPTGPTVRLDDTIVWIATTERDLWVVTFRSSDSTRRLVHIALKPSV
jgi:class 3 adenylate cyclase